VIFAIAISLNLSAVSLILPIGALIAYRARDVNWRAVLVGTAIGVVLLGSWRPTTQSTASATSA
jgi:hypothetical protein